MKIPAFSRAALFVTLAWSFGHSAAASAATDPAPSFDFRCVTDPPTTTFVLQTQGDGVVLTTIHHNGTKFMPIHLGIVVPNDIPYLESVAGNLEKMGERNVFRFPLKLCQSFGPGQMSCYGGNTQTLGGQEFEALSISTSVVETRSLGYTYENFRVTLSVNLNGFVPAQDITNDFYGDECQFGPGGSRLPFLASERSPKSFSPIH